MSQMIPQMKPIFWLYLYAYFTSALFLIVICNYFVYKSNNKSTSLTSSSKTYSWKW